MPSSAGPVLELGAPAKVNLALSVGAARADGMHPLASWMVAVHFGDVLRFEAVAPGEARFDRAYKPDAPLVSPIDWPVERDLGFRAADLLAAHAGRALPARIAMRKSIPTGAGLGGGSSDAAAVLVGLNQLFDLGVTADELQRLGHTLGSDVPFLVGALMGAPSAVVLGVGEVSEPAPLSELIPLVLIFPPLTCPTAEVYRAFDSLHAEGMDRPMVDLERVRQLAAQRPLPVDGPFNDLTAAAFRVRPELADAHARVKTSLGLPVHVTGSGVALFVVAPSVTTAKVLARKVTATTGLPAVATRTLAG